MRCDAWIQTNRIEWVTQEKLHAPAEHLCLASTDAGMLHDFPKGPNQDAKEEHARQHHHYSYALHITQALHAILLLSARGQNARANMIM